MGEQKISLLQKAGGRAKKGIGHDGCRVGINQHNLVSERPQGLASPSARVIELTGLTDDNRAGTDDHNLVDIGTCEHCPVPLRSLKIQSKLC